MISHDLVANQPMPAIEQPPTSAAHTGAVLEVLGLTKTFRSGLLRRATPAVRGISFAVPRGTIFAVLGHNGAGKTTTLNCVLGLLRPDAGTIRIFGQDNSDVRSRARVGYLPERPYFYEHLTGRELLIFYAGLLEVPARERAQQVAIVLDQVNLADRADWRLRKYSKGMLQRLGLAQAILNDPDLWILDEPMSGLDPLGRHAVHELLHEFRARGKTIVLSSHIVPDVEQLADEVVIFRQGLVAEHRELRTLRGDPIFRVRLTALPANSATEGVLRNCRVHGADQRDDTVLVEACDPADLAALLDLCSQTSVTVHSVQTLTTGLEELFLSAMKQEVAAP